MTRVAPNPDNLVIVDLGVIAAKLATPALPPEKLWRIMVSGPAPLACSAPA